MVGARALLAAVPARLVFIADKAFDADDLRTFVLLCGATPVICPMPNRVAPPPSTRPSIDVGT
jgi:hypothetical protein